jgi:hypothetical protein
MAFFAVFIKMRNSSRFHFSFSPFFKLLFLNTSLIARFVRIISEIETGNRLTNSFRQSFAVLEVAQVSSAVVGLLPLDSSITSKLLQN